MSILSTNKKLISVGAEYSAGSGINITDHIISVVESAVGTNYSAGPNIDIYDVEGQPTISSKDWSNDIADASANAYEQAIAQIPAPQDLSYISGRIDTNTSGIDYISSVCLTAHQDWTDTIRGASSYSYEQSTSYFDNWISGQYTGDITNITNKITALSGDFSSYYKKTETSSKDEINDALQYVSANAGKVYEGVSPIVVNNVEDKISADTWTFSAGSNVSFVDDNVNKITRIDCSITGEGGDPQVNSFVYDNSAKINDVNSSYQSNSGTFLTAAPANMATTGDVAELAQSVSETYQVKGDYAERAFVLSSIESATSGKLDVSSFASVSSDFLTNEDLNGYATESFVENVSGDIVNLIPDTSNFITNASAEETYQPIGNYLSANALEGYATEQWVGEQGYLTEISIPESGNWDEATTTVQTNSSTWDNVTNKLDTTAFSDVSSTFLTAVDLTPYQTIEGMTAYQPVGDYYTTAEAETLSSMLSGAIDYVSANAGDEFPVSADEAIQYVQTNSANIDEVITNYQTASGTYLTAHQSLEGYVTESGFDYDSNNKISGYNGSAFAGQGGGGNPEVDSYVQTNSATIDDVNTNVTTNSGAWGGSALPISAGPGIKVNLVDNTLVFSNDETVLWTGTGSTTGSTINLNESLTHFEKYGLYYYIPYQETNQTYYQEFIYKQGQSVFGIKTDGMNSTLWRMYCDYGTMTDTSISLVSGRQGGVWLTASPQEITWYDGSERHHYITKVVGINRK